MMEVGGILQDARYDAENERRILNQVIRRALLFADDSGKQTVAFPLLTPRGFGLRRIEGERIDEAGVAGVGSMVPAILGYLENTAASVTRVVILVERFRTEILSAVEKFRN